MNSNEIRQAFISFFEERDHVVRPSASLIPIDPTLLMTNAGMVPFKPYFLGEEEPPYKRAVTAQKVVRTIDIDIIGTTQRHLSFFEMLGNFSFGDYFKQEAIDWSYEFSVDVLGLDPERLWFTVHDSDDEAAEIWIDGVGAPADRVQRGGKENFWQMGIPGPCGPSSELFYDMGPEYGEEGGPIGGSEDRYLEYWNLVFMQNIQDEPYNVIGDLPAKNIDTGMGLDRIAAILQEVPSVFDIDTTRYVREAAERNTALEYGANAQSDTTLRILADHGRSVTFLIGDGVVPSNDGRGYVLRRLLRRAVRHAWQFSGDRLIMPELVNATVDVMGDWYTDLAEKRDLIIDVVTREEERFRQTLESGHQLLDTELSEDSSEGLSGATVFKLHDTYGFPIELTKEIAAERGVEVDVAGFEAEMEAQRQRAREAWKGKEEAAAADTYRNILDEVGLSEFLGYEQESNDGLLLAVVADGETVDRAEEGRDVELFLDRTSFYAEAGGQVGDTGLIETETGIAEVVDTQHAIQGLYGHRARVTTGYIAPGQNVKATVNSPRREAIRKSHTGTHVLHWALRDILGDHAGQEGSLVEPGRIRFDFSHFAATTPEEIAEIEAEVNYRLIANSQVNTTVTSQEKAKEMGAIAFFGDKYGETVRVVQVGEFSTEFCGGTHTSYSGQVGPLTLISESSIGSNIRRVEALTGASAYDHLASVRATLDEVGGLLRVGQVDVVPRIEKMMETVSGLEKELDAIRTQKRGSAAKELAEAAENVGDYSLVVADAGDMGGNELRELALGIRGHLDAGALIVVGAAHQGKGAIVGLATKDLVEAGVSAAEVIRGGAFEMGGGGSRDPELAQAGGPNGNKLESALSVARAAAESTLGDL